MQILDTNVISELMRPSPNERLVAWISAQPAGSLFTTAVTEAELRYGMALLPAGKRREQLFRQFNLMMTEDFASRILPFDRSAAKLYASIVAGRRRSGRPISQFDGQIAAIARSRDGGIVTRNDQDFSDCDIPVINPWMH
ncbi:MAG: type II toxin-antitoxin system VapC family toxin [Wenzhouxiangella sp.]|jgi:predicted nucleic acid-binding protein|nr:type II toxin-antitoxin system VapC family toxin [Wenzhouxiangella sp.]